MSPDNFVFFWGGPFSQWYKHEMVIDGVTYVTSEQFMMTMKAAHFKDVGALIKIMSTNDPKVQKAIGRTVKNFDPVEWNEHARTYVEIGNLAKFKDPKLKEILLSTDDKEIVEASPYDKVWGIGLGQDDPRRFDKSQWQGTNWLGEVLMKVRAILRENE